MVGSLAVKRETAVDVKRETANVKGLANFKS
jgi:hypothetical protein